MPESSTPRGPATSRKKRIIFAIAAISIGISPFVILELVARAAGWGDPTAYYDPFVGFSTIAPLFQLDEETNNYTTTKSRLYYFSEQEFVVPKSPGTFRVFCLGGSSVLGHPYYAETAFPKWLELELNGRNHDRQHEVINCGGMSYASYRLTPILSEVLDYDPDLIVVMTGHNEFLEDRTYESIKNRNSWLSSASNTLFSLRTVTLARQLADKGKPTLSEEVDALLDHKSGYASYHWDPDWIDDVTNHFQFNIQNMIDLCSKRSVPIVFATPGANLRDCPPFKSENHPDLATADRERYNGLFNKADEAESLNEALKLYQAAETIDETPALLAFRIAKCLDRLGRVDEALPYYVKAREHDVCPLRILSKMQNDINTVCEENNIPVLDVALALTKQSADSISGFDMYVDHVHPSISGHQYIAQNLSDLLAENEIVPAGRWDSHDRQSTYSSHMNELGTLYLAQGRQRVEWLDGWARRDRLRADLQPHEARDWINLGHSYLEFGENRQALDAYSQAVSMDQATVAELVVHAAAVRTSGRTSTADLIDNFVKRQGSRNN